MNLAQCIDPDKVRAPVHPRRPAPRAAMGRVLHTQTGDVAEHAAPAGDERSQYVDALAKIEERRARAQSTALREQRAREESLQQAAREKAARQVDGRDEARLERAQQVRADAERRAEERRRREAILDAYEARQEVLHEIGIREGTSVGLLGAIGRFKQGAGVVAILDVVSGVTRSNLEMFVARMRARKMLVRSGAERHYTYALSDRCRELLAKLAMPKARP